MGEFFDWLISALSSLASLLDSYRFSFGGLSASLFEIFLGFVAISMVITIFWKGARG